MWLLVVAITLLVVGWIAEARRNARLAVQLAKITGKAGDLKAEIGEVVTPVLIEARHDRFKAKWLRAVLKFMESALLETTNDQGLVLATFTRTIGEAIGLVVDGVWHINGSRWNVIDTRLQLIIFHIALGRTWEKIIIHVEGSLQKYPDLMRTQQILDVNPDVCHCSPAVVKCVHDAFHEYRSMCAHRRQAGYEFNHSFTAYNELMVDPWKIPVEFTGTRDHNCDIHARLKLADAMPQPVLEQMAAAAEAEAAQAEAAQPEPGYPRTILLRYHACSEQGGDVSGTREAVLKTCEVDIEGELNRITLELRGQGLRLIRYESADDSFDLGAMVRAVAAAVPPEVYPRIFSIRYQAEKLDGKIVMGISDVVLQHCEAEIALAVERIKENLKARELTNIRFEAEDPEIDLDAMLMRAGARGLVKEYRNESPVDDAAGQPPLGSEMTMQIGLVMFERGDYKSAIPNFHLVQKDPEAKGRALYWEARCWFMLEQYDIAYERLTAALADDKIDRDTKHDAAVKFDSVKRLLEQRALKSDQEPLAPETPPNFGGDPVHEPGNPKTE